MSAGDVEAVREVYEAYNAGDYERGEELLHEEVELHQWGAVVDSDVYKGRQEFVRGLVRWTSGFEPGFQYLPEDLVDGPAGVLMRCRLRGRGRASGAELEELTWHVWEVRDGKPYRCAVYSEEADARAAAGLPSG